MILRLFNQLFVSCGMRAGMFFIGLFLFPLHVYAATQTHNPTTVIDMGGGYPWSNPSNAATQDDAYAETPSLPMSWSNAMRGTQYGFTIPTDATISGIVVEVNLWGMPSPYVSIVKNGTATGERSTSTARPASDDDVYSIFGSPTEMWGTTWTPGDINAANFGASIRANGMSFSKVDEMRIVVYYTAPVTVTLSSGVGQCTSDGCPQDFGGCGYGVVSGGGTYPVTIGFSTSVTGFTSGDISVTNGTVQSLSGAGGSYTATITSSCTNCLVEVSVGNNVVNEGNVGAGPLWLPWGQDYWKFCDAWCSSMSVPEGYSIVLQSDDTTPVNFNSFGDIIPVRIKKGTVRLVELNLAISGGDAACDDLVLGQQDQASLVHGFADIFGAHDSSYALFIPKIAQHTTLRVCSGKATLGCTVSDNWSFIANEAGAITSTNNGFDTTGITVAITSGYWKVSGLTGTSAEGEGAATSAASSSVPFFPWWGTLIIVPVGLWVLKREGLLWQ